MCECFVMLNFLLVLDSGPFQQMNAEDIDNEVNDMWRLMYKLNKTFGDVVGPRTTADKIRRKVEQFKTHLPLLHVICNPGMYSL